MKRMQASFPTVAAAALLAALATGPQAAAQADPSGRASRQAGEVVSVDFEGGTLADFADALRDAGKDVNILLPDTAHDVAVPAVTLRQASVEAALNAVGSIVDPNYLVEVRTQRAGQGNSVHALRVLAKSSQQVSGVVAGNGPGSSRPTDVQVFSLRSLTESLPGDPEGATNKAETILTAVETGLGVAGETNSKAVLRYHEDSGLLFVRGTRVETGLVQSILHRMNEHVVQQRMAARQVQGRLGAAPNSQPGAK